MDCVQASQISATKAAPTAEAEAPVDITGFWVSLIETDWRWRMTTPPRGQYNRASITPAAKEFADHWDPAKDAAAGEQCRAYGAAALMRVPGRLHITWQDPNTLRIDTDAGEQTRLLHFGPAPQHPESTWQGTSIAHWDIASAAAGSKARQRYGSLHIVTTHMRLGYLLKNGLPYSSNAVMTEDWDFMTEDGSQWIAITTTIVDPLYLTRPRETSALFRREQDGSKWHPTPCAAE